MFSDMIQAIKDEVVEYMFKVRLASESDQQQQQPRSRSHGQRKSAGGDAEPVNEPIHIPDKPGRNDLCPCGSGKKYKKCHGRNEQ